MASNLATNNRFDKLSRLFSRSLIPFALLVFATPFLSLLFYASMNTDDYLYATNACPVPPATRSVIRASWLNYMLGTGRWLTSIIHGLVMTKIDLVAFYGWLLLAFMLTNIAALAYCFANFLRVSRNQALLAACVFYAAWLATVVTPIEGVFWLTEAIEYQLTLTTILILAGLLCRSRHTTFSYLVLAGLAIAVPAQHEVAGSFLFVCLLAGVVAARVQKLETRQWWLCLGLVALSLAAVMFSPGKALQFAQGHNTRWDFAYVLPYAKHAVNLGVGWFINPAVLISAFCMPLVLWPHAESSTESQYRPPRLLALVGLGIMCILVVEFEAAEMTSGYGTLPYRTVGWFQFVFSLLFVCVILVGLPELSQMKFSQGSRIGLSLLLMATLLGSGNFRLAEQDLRGPARSYWSSSVARLRQHGASLQFDQLPRRPALFRPTEIATTPNCWVNRCMAVYLGANTVVVKDPSERTFNCQPCVVKDPIQTSDCFP